MITLLRSVLDSNYHRAPARRSVPFVGDAPKLLADPLGAFLAGWRECGDVVRFRVAPREAYLVVHPDHVRHVLHERRTIYKRDRWHTAQLQEISGRGLTASEGALWSEQRSRLRPAIQGGVDVAQAQATVRATTRMLERWAEVAKAGETVDLYPEMLRLSLEILSEALFSVNLEQESRKILRATSIVLNHLYRCIRTPFPVAARVAHMNSANVKAARRTLYDLAARLLEERNQRPSTGDLLSLLAEYDDRRLARDQIVTVILAGHDTTGAALAWAGQLISTHPAVDSRLHTEAVESKILSTGKTPDKMSPLTYAKGVFREALRLYPPAWVLSRTPTIDDTIAGYAIPAGATVFVSPFVTHRHREFWPDAERFRPERFADEDGTTHPYAYLPFGGGPRMCIGKLFAETVGQIVISMVSRSYRLVPMFSRSIDRLPRLTLRPKAPMRVRLVSRTDES